MLLSFGILFSFAGCQKNEGGQDNLVKSETSVEEYAKRRAEKEAKNL